MFNQFCLWAASTFAGCHHWSAVHSVMDQSLGPIKIYRPEDGKRVYAFFEQQTLIGDAARTHKEVHSHPVVWLDMNEAIGSGSTHEEAVVALWNKLVTLRPYESILRLVERSKSGEARGYYTPFFFAEGKFEAGQRITKDPPPERPDEILAFFKNGGQMRKDRIEGVQDAPARSVT